MNWSTFKKALLSTTLVASMAAVTGAADWPQWGGTPNKNMVSSETNIPAKWKPGEINDDESIKMSTTENVKWVISTGSQTYGNPTIANGKVYVGTNNDAQKDARFKGDFSILLCLDEKTGEKLWKLTVPKLGAGKVSDWEYLGICSSPAIDGDRVYLVTNRCEVLCLDANGFKNGNDGFKDEGKYYADLEKIAQGKAKPVEVNPEIDADIVWQYDLRDQLGIFPHNITSSSILVIGDMIYLSTSNGVDWSHTNIPSPNAPSLIALNKKTGELAGEEMSGISQRILHGGWSSPSFSKVGDKSQILFGGPDGILYGFDPRPVLNSEEELWQLPELWRFDANPITYRYKNGDKSKPIKYVRPDGPSEFIATPVVYKNRVYAAIGQDPEHGEGLGNLVCVDATQKGDITKTAEIWHYRDINRVISTVAIKDDILYVADYAGVFHCLDAITGKPYYTHDTLSHIWGSPLVVDGKVYIGNEDGDIYVFKHGKEKKILSTINMGAPVYSTPVAANKTLYIASMSHLYAISEGGK